MGCFCVNILGFLLVVAMAAMVVGANHIVLNLEAHGRFNLSYRQW